MAVVTPAEFRAARESLGLSAEKMGALLCLKGRQVRRYEAGASVISPLVARVVRLLVGGGEFAADLRASLALPLPEIPPGPTLQGKGEEETRLGEGSRGPDPS